MKRIRYVSEFTSELSAEELDELARISDENNRQDSLTGVLVLGVEQGNIDRLCPDWAMNKLDLSRETEARFEPLRALLGVIAQQRNVIEDLTGVLERVMWHELIDAQPVD
jgi:hypothetical protein